MISEQEVEQFLYEFKLNTKIWGMLFLDRPANLQTLETLEIRPKEREEIVLNLRVVNYSDGPKSEDQFGGVEMWIFGTEIRKHEIYIKITKGKSDENTICISFHISQYPMDYPFNK